MKARVEFNGDMDEYRAAVNANMTDNPTMWGKVKKVCRDATRLDLSAEINDANGITEVVIKDLQGQITELKVALDTARTAMANLHGKVAAREVEYEDRIKELETQITNERLIRKENDYDVDMKGIQL